MEKFWRQHTKARSYEQKKITVFDKILELIIIWTHVLHEYDFVLHQIWLPTLPYESRVECRKNIEQQDDFTLVKYR